LDTNIYFLDVGVKDNTTTRSEITNFINTINKKYKPKVIALDVTFNTDPLISDDVNSRLINSLANDNIVLRYSLFNREGQWLKNKSELPLNYNIVR